MITIQPSIFLRRVLLANAAGNGLLGSAAILATGQLAELLGLTPSVVLGAGIYLVVHAAVVTWLAATIRIHRAVIWALMVFNAAWAFESIVLVALQLIQPNGMGTLVVCAEAWIALAFVELQHVGLCRSTARHPAPSGPRAHQA